MIWRCLSIVQQLERSVRLEKADRIGSYGDKAALRRDGHYSTTLRRNFGNSRYDQLVVVDAPAPDQPFFGATKETHGRCASLSWNGNQVHVEIEGLRPAWIDCQVFGIDQFRTAGTQVE